MLPSEEPTFGSPRAGWPQASEGATREGTLQADYLSIPVIPDLPLRLSRHVTEKQRRACPLPLPFMDFWPINS